MSGIGDAVVVLGLAAVLAVLAVRLGMLVAPLLGRLTESAGEDQGGEHD